VLIATSAGADQVDLVWTDNATDEAGFKIERSLDNIVFSPAATTGANVTSYSDGGRTASTTYWYRVSAWNASGDSACSNTDSATTDVPPPPPQAPSVLTAVSSGSSSINLSWIDNADDEQGFEIERSTDNIIFESAGSTGANITVFPDTGRAAETTYWYRVYAYNGSGNSAFSNTGFAITDAAPAISLTLDGYKIKGKHTIDLSWSGTTAANVDIYRDGALLLTVPDTGEHTDFTSNKGGRTYEYQLCEAGTSNCSAVGSVTF
jgi:titin